MFRLFTLTLALSGALSIAAANAADLGPAGGFCLRLTPSPLLDSSDRAAIGAQIDRWYVEAVAVSQSAEVIASRRPAFLWASEAKVYCGMAKGFLSSGEIDAETVSKCDCCYGRMAHFLR